MVLRQAQDPCFRFLVLAVFEGFQGVPPGVGRGLIIRLLFTGLVHTHPAQGGLGGRVALAFGMHVADGQAQADALEEVVRQVHFMGVGAQAHQFLIIRAGLAGQLEDLSLVALHRLAQGGVAVVAGHVGVALHMDGGHEQVLALVQRYRGRHMAAQRVACSSGTNRRSLAEDLGAALGCGGHVAALRRWAVGAFSVADALPLDALTPESVVAHLRPPAVAVAHLPRLDVGESDALRLSLGQRLPAAADAPPGNTAAFGPDGRFLGVVEVDGDVIRPRKMLNVTEL